MRRAPATIVIPVWNAWEHTRRCLDSLRPTLGLRDQVVVVDNGSTDATAAELARRSWLTVITNAENRGFAGACNQGADAATSDVIVFLNNDTLTPSRWLDSLVAPLEADDVVAAGPRSNAVSGPQLVAQASYDGSRLGELQRFARTWREGHKGTTDVERLVGFCLAVKASAFRAVGGFDERFEVGGYEDDDLCLRLRDAGGRLVIAHESFVHHVGHQTFKANDVDWRELQERNRTVLEAKHQDEVRRERPLVSACLIVRDEAENIAECIASVEGFADQVVVHDTGSLDGTPELAEAAGATVIRGEWRDDFAQARNVALAACSGEWVLWIDADERLTSPDLAQVRSRLARSTGCDGYVMPIANAVGDGSGSRSTFEAPRLFRKDSARWEGRVHEQLVALDGSRLVWRTGLDIGIEHFGYLDAVLSERGKSERNLRLLEVELAEHPDSPVALGNLGRALFAAARYEEALEVSRGVAARTDVDAGVRRRAYQAVADAALRLRRWDDARAAIEGLRSLGRAEITVAGLAAQLAVATGDAETALRELDALRPGLKDADGFRLTPSALADARASALHALNRPGAAARELLTVLQQGQLDKALLGNLLSYLRWAHLPLDPMVEVLSEEHRLTLLAVAEHLIPQAAGDLFEAMWRSRPGDLGVLAAVARDGSRLDVQSALAWSDRLRQRDLDEHCPLVAIATTSRRTAQDRVLAGLLAGTAFGDDRGLAVLGRAAAAVPPVDREALVGTVRELCPDAVPLLDAVYRPELPAGKAYRCTVVLPVVADLAAVLTCLQSLAEGSLGEDAEVVCVADGLDEGREALLDSLGGDVRVVRLPLETGLAHAWNVGLRAAAGEQVVLLDPTSTVARGWLTAVLSPVAPGRAAAVGPVGAPAVVAAAREDLLAVGGADSRLDDVVALGDLVSRLRAGGREVCVLPPTLAVREAVVACVQPDAPTGNALWERVSGGDAGDVALAAEPSSESPRVRVHGFLNGEMGLGEAGRAMVESLEAAGVTVATKSYAGHSNRNENPFAERPSDGGPYPIELFCFNAESTTGVLSKGPREESGEYTIGLWYWELETIPPWMISGLRWLDEVWVGSDFIRDALRRVTRVPVMTVPPLVAAHHGRPTVTRQDVGLPEGFLFGFTFDHNSTMARKNPIGLVEAFKQAFAPGEGPQLVIKAINAANWPENQARLTAAIGDRPDITVLERYLPSDQSHAFTGLFDCWVSLHRSEGFGLTMAEAMAWGTPVVATGYSANLDYMDETNGWLVPFTGGTVEPGVAAYAEGEWWAEPDVAAAARILREVWQDPDEAAVRGERGRETMRTRYSAGTIGAIARARLDQVAAGLSESAALTR